MEDLCAFVPLCGFRGKAGPIGGQTAEEVLIPDQHLSLFTRISDSNKESHHGPSDHYTYEAAGKRERPFN